jgi:hypothetical protein
VVHVEQPKLSVIQRNWILITYDIPRRNAALRRSVLRRLYRLGAVRHTDSVYYLPYSYEALSAISGVSDVYVWCSELTVDEQAEQLTQHYMKGLIGIFEGLLRRIESFSQFLESYTGDLRQVRQRLKGLSREANVLFHVAQHIPAHLLNASPELRGAIDSCREKLDNLWRLYEEKRRQRCS